MNIAREIKNDIAGLQILKDWLGDDTCHVRQELADHRSLACVHGNGGNPCPHNKAPKWWETAKHVVADAIREQLEVKNKLNMTTPFDKHLNMCSKCGCCLTLKVWTPIQHIRSHTTPSQINSLPSYCWMAQELKSYA